MRTRWRRNGDAWTCDQCPGPWVSGAGKTVHIGAVSKPFDSIHLAMSWVEQNFYQAHT